MSIKAPILETPEVRKACDLMVNIKSVMYLVGVVPAMAKQILNYLPMYPS